MLLMSGGTQAAEYGRDDPWSASIYVGPWTTKYIGAIVQSFNDHPTAAMAAASLNRRILDLGWGVWVSSDSYVSQTWFGHHDTSYGVGLGLRIDGPLGFRHSTFSVYDGPSWDTSPPHLVLGYHNKVHHGQGHRFLNYLGVEEAVALSREGKWDVIFRILHRSGMFGVYSMGDDESTLLGVGLRYRF